MTVFTFVRISRHKEVFFGNRLDCGKALNKFDEDVSEIFGDELLVAINTVKNILVK